MLREGCRRVSLIPQNALAEPAPNARLADLSAASSDSLLG